MLPSSVGKRDARWKFISSSLPSSLPSAGQWRPLAADCCSSRSPRWLSSGCSAAPEGIVRQRLAPSWPLVLLAVLAFFLLLQAVPLLATKNPGAKADSRAKPIGAIDRSTDNLSVDLRKTDPVVRPTGHSTYRASCDDCVRISSLSDDK